MSDLKFHKSEIVDIDTVLTYEPLPTKFTVDGISYNPPIPEFSKQIIKVKNDNWCCEDSNCTCFLYNSAGISFDEFNKSWYDNTLKWQPELRL